MLASFWIDTLMSATGMSLRLLASNLRLARNLHQAALIPWLPESGAIVTPTTGTPKKERQSVIEIERDGRVGIDLKFGSITFKEEESGTYAVALVDVIVDAEGLPGGTRVQMEVKSKADPETESILDVTERCRAQIAATLRATADRFDGMSARSLLFERTG